MEQGAPGTLLGEWARLVADTLVQSGVREVVISPGSRSTPFVVAITAREELRCVDVLDERSAGFVALGMARASGRAVALLCTSGTAPAHWFPAVIEASLADVPLVCLSADRPLEHTHCGAAQTIDQLELFGKHVRWFAEVGAPDASEGALVGLRRTIAQAVARARSPRAGPVHVNLRARKPLEPREPRTDAELALRERVERVRRAPLTEAPASRAMPARESIEEVARALEGSRRTWIVAGPMPASAGEDGTRDAVLAIARSSSALLFAEATSQLRFGGAEREGVERLDALDLSLRASDVDADAPELVLQVGGTPTSAALDRFFAARPTLARIVVGVSDWIDAHGTARAILIGDRVATLQALAAELRGAGNVDVAWRERWLARERRAWTAIEEELETGAFGEGTVARTLVRSLPRGAALSIGNSLPVRTIDRFARSGGDALVVHSQRGANGIDGLVSGAIGASLASGRPGALMLGDLSLLHDVGGLASARAVRTPLAIVVVQNGGGRIFEQLPVARVAPHAMPHFLTPQDAHLEHAAALFALPFARVLDASGLRDALARAMSREGVSVIEAVVPPHGAREADARVEARARSGR